MKFKLTQAIIAGVTLPLTDESSVAVGNGAEALTTMDDHQTKGIAIGENAKAGPGGIAIGDGVTAGPGELVIGTSVTLPLNEFKQLQEREVEKQRLRDMVAETKKQRRYITVG